jgi:hypothetical protein
MYASAGDYASVLRPTSPGKELYLIPSMLPEVRPAQLQDLWPAKKGIKEFKEFVERKEC